jgi:hypothetical protein
MRKGILININETTKYVHIKRIAITLTLTPYYLLWEV